MGYTALFTYLKIILLQCFLFLAISGIQIHPQYMFGSKLKCRLILLFSLFFLLFMGSIALFVTIHEFQCTVSTNFYLYLLYFQQKIFSFSKINRSQTSPQYHYLRVQPSCSMISIFHVESHGYLVGFPVMFGSIF